MCAFASRSFSSGQTRLSVDETTLKVLPSGPSGFSPDETLLKAFPSGQSRDPPDGKPLRLARQNHFGSQCATERVYWHLPAKVELPKSHFGKPPLTECALRRPPCQSDLAEARRVGKQGRSRKTPFESGCGRDTSRGCGD